MNCIGPRAPATDVPSMRPNAGLDEVDRREVLPVDPEPALRLAVVAPQLGGRPGVDDAPGGQLGGQVGVARRVHRAELPAGRDVGPGVATQRPGQQLGHPAVPAGTVGHRPVGQLLGVAGRTDHCRPGGRVLHRPVGRLDLRGRLARRPRRGGLALQGRRECGGDVVVHRPLACPGARARRTGPGGSWPATPWAQPRPPVRPSTRRAAGRAAGRSPPPRPRSASVTPSARR